MTEEQKKRVPCNLSLTLSAIEPYLKAGKNILRVGKKELRIALALQKEINQNSKHIVELSLQDGFVVESGKPLNQYLEYVIVHLTEDYKEKEYSINGYFSQGNNAM